MNAPIILLAAGMGSRFGGPKQLVPVRPDGASLLAIAAEEALQAGFDHLVVVTRTQLEAQVLGMLDLILPNAPRTLVLQDRYGTPRAKPWGTAHAIAACAEQVTHPFGIANADDHYGIESFAALFQVLSENAGGIVAFPIRSTLSPNGAVTRGLVTAADGKLVDVDERGGLHLEGGSIRDGNGHEISEDRLVSMNLWTLPGWVASELQTVVQRFEADHAGDPTAECLLPTEIGVLVERGRLQVQVAATSASWAGLTHPDDLEPLRTRFSSIGTPID